MAGLGAEGISKKTAFLLSFAIWVVMALLDSQITYQIGFSIFYLIPISLAVYYGGFRQGVVIAVLSAIAWGFNDWYTGHRYDNHWMPLWNSLMRLGYYLLHSIILKRYKTLLLQTRQLAYTDALTGAYNGRYLYSYLARMKESARADAKPLTFVYIDLDNFKEVNDLHGHEEGDEVLRVLAETVTGTIGKEGFLARLGGDEFVLVLVGNEFNAARKTIEQVNSNVLAEFRRRGWPVTLSIGALTYTDPRKLPTPPLQHVDKLMYKVKKAGKSAIRHEMAK